LPRRACFVLDEPIAIGRHPVPARAHAALHRRRLVEHFAVRRQRDVTRQACVAQHAADLAGDRLRRGHEVSCADVLDATTRDVLGELQHAHRGISDGGPVQLVPSACVRDRRNRGASTRRRASLDRERAATGCDRHEQHVTRIGLDRAQKRLVACTRSQIRVVFRPPTLGLLAEHVHVVWRRAALFAEHAVSRAAKRLQRTERRIQCSERHVRHRAVVLVLQRNDRERGTGPHEADVARMIVERAPHRFEGLLEPAARGADRCDRSERVRQLAGVIRRARAVAVVDIAEERAGDERGAVRLQCAISTDARARARTTRADRRAWLRVIRGEHAEVRRDDADVHVRKHAAARELGKECRECIFEALLQVQHRRRIIDDVQHVDIETRFERHERDTFADDAIARRSSSAASDQRAEQGDEHAGMHDCQCRAPL
jgi:hypothetical protein